MPSTEYTPPHWTPDQTQEIVFELELLRGELLAAAANVERLIVAWTQKPTAQRVSPDVAPQLGRRGCGRDRP